MFHQVPTRDSSGPLAAQAPSAAIPAAQRAPVVYVIDDDDAVRRSIRLLLKSVGLSAAAFASAQEFLAVFDPEQPGCALVDVRMPGMSGLELQHELNLRGALVPIVFVTGHGDIPMAVEAIQQGAFDFLQKPFRDQDLLGRVQRALEHDRVNRTESRQIDAIRMRLECLTPREREVFELVTSGRRNKVMATELGVSQRTIEIHRARVMDKMGAASLAQLVRMRLDLVHGSAANH
jgi:FixJ family two-component response regulator